MFGIKDDKSLPQLCCPKCGSLNVGPGMPNVQKKTMPVFCEDCKELSDVNIKITGVSEDGKLQVQYVPTLIMTDFNKDRTQKYLVL